MKQVTIDGYEPPERYEFFGVSDWFNFCAEKCSCDLSFSVWLTQNHRESKISRLFKREIMQCQKELTNPRIKEDQEFMALELEWELLVEEEFWQEEEVRVVKA